MPPAAVIALLRSGGCTDKDALAPLFYALSCRTWELGLSGGGGGGHRIAPLAHADVARFILGLERLRTAFAGLAIEPPGLAGLDAAHKIRCDAAVVRFWQASVSTMLLAQNATTARRPVEVLKDVVASARASLVAHGACTPCAEAIVAHVTRRRAALWASIPEYFGLV